VKVAGDDTLPLVSVAVQVTLFAPNLLPAIDVQETRAEASHWPGPEYVTVGITKVTGVVEQLPSTVWSVPAESVGAR
jgi:hypothetical protein